MGRVIESGYRIFFMVPRSFPILDQLLNFVSGPYLRIVSFSEPCYTIGSGYPVGTCY